MTNWIAFTISSVCARPAPWSGRSDAMMYFASLGPWSAVHADDGTVLRLPPPPPLFVPPPQPVAASASAPVTTRANPTTPSLFTLPPPVVRLRENRLLAGPEFRFRTGSIADPRTL